MICRWSLLRSLTLLYIPNSCDIVICNPFINVSKAGYCFKVMVDPKKQFREGGWEVAFLKTVFLSQIVGDAVLALFNGVAGAAMFHDLLNNQAKSLADALDKMGPAVKDQVQKFFDDFVHLKKGLSDIWTQAQHSFDLKAAVLDGPIKTAGMALDHWHQIAIGWRVPAAHPSGFYTAGDGSSNIPASTTLPDSIDELIHRWPQVWTEDWTSRNRIPIEELEGKHMISISNGQSALVINGQQLQIDNNDVRHCFPTHEVKVTPGVFGSVPLGVKIAQGQQVVTDGGPGCFKMSNDERWGVTCIEPVGLNGSQIQTISAQAFANMPAGPNLIYQKPKVYDFSAQLPNGFNLSWLEGHIIANDTHLAYVLNMKKIIWWDILPASCFSTHLIKLPDHEEALLKEQRIRESKRLEFLIVNAGAKCKS